MCSARLIAPVVSLLVAASICRADAGGQKSFLDAQTIIDAWQSNYAGIDSYRVQASQRVVKGADPCELTYSCLDMVEDRGRFHVWMTNSALGFDEKEQVIIASFDGRQRKDFRGAIKEARIVSGSLAPQGVADLNPLLPVLGSVRVMIKDRGVSIMDPVIRRLKEEFPAGIPGVTLDFGMAKEYGHVAVRPELEVVAGVSCHVVEVEGGSSQVPETTWWFAHERSMLRVKSSSRYRNGQTISKEVLELASVKMETGELWYPRKAIYQEQKGADKDKRVEIEVPEFVPHIKVPDSTFDITFPPGTRVHDEVLNMIYRVREEPKTDPSEGINHRSVERAYGLAMNPHPAGSSMSAEPLPEPAPLSVGRRASSTPSVDELISRIADAERRLINIKIECETSEEQRASPADAWKPTGVSLSSTVWLNGLPKSKARVDVHQETSRHLQDAVAKELNSVGFDEEALRHVRHGFVQASYSVGFDGQTGRVVRHASGAPGALFEQKRAEILPSAPFQLTSGWCRMTTGAAFCLNFVALDRVAADQAVTFSTLLSWMKAAGAELGITYEKYQGADCIRISVGDPNRGETFWLDAEHGLAFRGFENATIRDGSKYVWKRKVVTEIAEVAPGVWYPREAYWQYGSPDPNRPSEKRVLFRASKLVANDPFFDENVFRTPIPPGYIVTDKILGTRYRTRLDEESQER